MDLVTSAGTGIYKLPIVAPLSTARLLLLAEEGGGNRAVRAPSGLKLASCVASAFEGKT